ncbi:MAG: TatD family hydrolase [Candidatus Micrarchaeales archaeon]
MEQHTSFVELEKPLYSIQTEFSDAHCHLNLFKNVDEVLAEARKRGVGIIITSGGNAKDNEENCMLTRKESIFAVIGIGPDSPVPESDFTEEVEKIIKSNEKIVGIGEIGIDVKKEMDIGVQKRLFRMQLELANKLDFPVVIHSRGALKDVLEIIEKVKVKRIMFHFFEGDEKQAIELAKKGYLISIPPAETEKRKKIILEVGLESLVVETDSPIVGKTPADVVKVCATIAKLKNIPLEDVAAKTTENIRRLFYI